jgi:hypothetical protein
MRFEPQVKVSVCVCLFVYVSKACSGLTHLNAGRVPQLSDRSLRSVLRYCPGLLLLDLRECPLVTAEAAAAARAARGGRLSVLSEPGP